MVANLRDSLQKQLACDRLRRIIASGADDAELLAWAKEYAEPIMDECVRLQAESDYLSSHDQGW
jgi:hypothetical protein